MVNSNRYSCPVLSLEMKKTLVTAKVAGLNLTRNYFFFNLNYFFPTKSLTSYSLLFLFFFSLKIFSGIKSFWFNFNRLSKLVWGYSDGKIIVMLLLNCKKAIALRIEIIH